MKKLFLKLSLLLPLVCGLVLAPIALIGTGCSKTTLPVNDTLYQGDVFLYQTEKATVTAHKLVVEFYRWEEKYRTILPVEVSRAADFLRKNEPQWIATSIAARDAYAGDPTVANRTKLDIAMDVIESALAQAAIYMALNKEVAPNTGLTIE